jgi:hypothetical protein
MPKIRLEFAFVIDSFFLVPIVLSCLRVQEEHEEPACRHCGTLNP